MKASLVHYLETPFGKEQAELTRRFISLLATAGPYSRQTLPGHFTASVVILDPQGKKVLLTHHRKLDRWLQLGGHADDEAELWRVALREVEEESGLRDVVFWPVNDAASPYPPAIFDLDEHWIPENPKEPGHFHYDVRYLGFAEQPMEIQISHESKALEWFPLPRAYEVVGENSLRRVFQKISSLGLDLIK